MASTVFPAGHRLLEAHMHSACGLVVATCLQLVQATEGLRLVPYVDFGRDGIVMAVGRGHDLRPGEPVERITLPQADRYAAQDVARSKRQVDELTAGIILTPGEREALCDLVFNLGPADIRTSTLLRKLRAGDKLGAAQEFLRWDHARHRVSAGLEARRRLERALFLSPDCP